MQARRFAEATGRQAKTDRIDAAMLAELGRCLKPTTRPVRSQARDTLAGLHKRRDQLVQQRAAETVRLGETAGLPEAVRANLIAHLDWLKAAIKARHRSGHGHHLARPDAGAGTALLLYHRGPGRA